MKTKLLATLILVGAFTTMISAQNYIRIDTMFFSDVIQEEKNIDIYLPPDYFDNPDQQYAVIYYMHGAGGDENSGEEAAVDYYSTHFQVPTHENPPAIFVCMDGSCEPYSGSFYVNSVLYGDYDDYIVQDVIGFVEEAFRAMPHRNFRFVTGWSMGGCGSAYHAAKNHDVFRACIPCIGLLNPTSDTIINNWKELVYAETGSYALNYNAGMHNRLLISACGAWSPNLNIPPYFIETPFDSLGNNVDTVLQKWNEFNICSMVQDLPDEHELSWFLIAGKYDHMGFYTSYLELMDSMDHYGIAYDSSYFNAGHSYDDDAWMLAVPWIDSIIDLSFTTQRTPSRLMDGNLISVFPNPTDGILYIKSVQELEEIQIFTISGQLCLKTNIGNEISVSDFPSGIYILEARTEAGVVRKKFVKK